MDRIILTLLSLFLILLSIITVLSPFSRFNQLIMENINFIVNWVRSNYLFSGIGLAILLIGIRVLYISLKGNGKTSKEAYLIQRTDYGEVNISSDTIIGLVESVSKKFSGIRNINTRVDILEGQLFITLIGDVSPEINIPETTKELQHKVKEHIEKCTGVNVSEIKVLISNVATPVRNVK